MADITLDLSAFRARCPDFADTARYPDASVRGYWAAATRYVAPADYGALAGADRAAAIELMCAHLLALADKAAAGQTAGVVTQAGVDKVTVQMAPPPLRSQWQWWLSTTPHGAQLLALLSVKAAGGLYVGAYRGNRA